MPNSARPLVQGFLHDGHVSLVQSAVENCDVVVTSIYVNPTQFSENEDFGVYPRSEDEDLKKLEQAGCAAVFMPSQMYHSTSNTSMVVGGALDGIGEDTHETWVTVEKLSQGLCAKSRPHFFRGVCTVVTKLFHIVQPDKAFFGKKDYQQWRVIERMCRDLDFGIEIFGEDIVREEDGLAMSSRNALLTPQHRAAAPAIYKALQTIVREKIFDTRHIVDVVSESVSGAGGIIDYVEVVSASTLQRVGNASCQPTLVAVAARFGAVRLIDNIEI